MQHTCIIVLQPEIAELATGKRIRVWSNIKPSEIVKTILKDSSFDPPEVTLYKQESLLEYKISTGSLIWILLTELYLMRVFTTFLFMTKINIL